MLGFVFSLGLVLMLDLWIEIGLGSDLVKGSWFGLLTGWLDLGIK